jgi:hypothetical protein
MFKGKNKLLISSKDLNDKPGHGIFFIDLQNGIKRKLQQIKRQFYSLNISVVKQMHKYFSCYPTNISYISQMSLVDKI